MNFLHIHTPGPSRRNSETGDRALTDEQSVSHPVAGERGVITEAPPLSPQLREKTVEVLKKSYAKLPGVFKLRPSASREQPVRLLSLDGGGVRGIGTLHILKHIMSKAGPEGLKPCDYFDMIAGTSTGGLIAIMLGRLEMTIDDCIEVYHNLSSKIFSQNRGLPRVALGHNRYSSSEFEETVKEFIKNRTGDSDTLMMQTDDKHCKVFVVAVQAGYVTNGASLHIRTYQPGENESILKSVKIWEACRATTAAPTYFKPMQIGDVHYQDGGLGYNNPACLLKAEAEAVFGPDTPIQCALSIGTGLAPALDLRGSTSILGVLNGNLGNKLLTLATKSEQYHLLARDLFNSRDQGCYFRFNVGEMLTDKIWVMDRDEDLYRFIYGDDSSVQKIPNLDDWKNALIALDDYKKMDQFAQICAKYIQDESLGDQVEKCAERLRLQAREFE